MPKKKSSGGRKNKKTAPLALFLIFIVCVLIFILLVMTKEKQELMTVSANTIATVDEVLSFITNDSQMLFSVQQENTYQGRPYLYSYKRFDYERSGIPVKREISKALENISGTQRPHIIFYSVKRQDDEKITTMKIGLKRIVFCQIEFVTPAPSTGETGIIPPIEQIEETNFLTNVIVRTQKPVKHIGSKAKICVILDDIGSDHNRLFEKSTKFPGKLTFAVMPELNDTDNRVEKLVTIPRFRIILHQPMEAINNEAREVRVSSNTINTNMSADEITAILKRSFGQVQGAGGLNNHQGSLATGNTRVMSVVMKYLRSKKLFFIDSVTSPDTVGSRIAKKMHVRYAKRDIFLDNEDNEAYVQSQFDKLIRKALKEGSAVGIGHGTKESTINVLFKNYERVKAQGIEFVWPDEVME